MLLFAASQYAHCRRALSLTPCPPPIVFEFKCSATATDTAPSSGNASVVNNSKITDACFLHSIPLQL